MPATRISDDDRSEGIGANISHPKIRRRSCPRRGYHVRAGEIVGFLGPNGAGKTTTLRMLTTLLTPTAGTASVAGCDLLGDPDGVRRRIGYVAQGGGTDPACPAGEEAIFQAELYRIERCRGAAPSQGIVRSI